MVHLGRLIVVTAVTASGCALLTNLSDLGGAADAGTDATIDATADVVVDAIGDVLIDGSADACSDAGAAIAAIQGASAENASDGSVTTLLMPGVGAHHLLVVGVANYMLGNVTDSNGDSFNNVLLNQNGASLAYAENVAAGDDTITVTLSEDAMGGTVEVFAGEFAGVAQTNALDVACFTTGTTTMTAVVASQPIVTTAPQDIIVAFVVTGTGAPGAGFQAIVTTSGDVMEYAVAPCPGTYQATATILGAAGWNILAAAFHAQ